MLHEATTMQPSIDRNTSLTGHHNSTHIKNILKIGLIELKFLIIELFKTAFKNTLLRQDKIIMYIMKYNER